MASAVFLCGSCGFVLFLATENVQDHVESSFGTKTPPKVHSANRTMGCDLLIVVFTKVVTLRQTFLPN